MTNVLLITADDMDARTPAAFGGPDRVTPNLDRLAEEGMTFQRGHVAAAVCQPSRSAIMTGLWPHRNGAEGFEPIHDHAGILNDVLKEAGYLTGILGKVDHLQPEARFGWDTARGMREMGLGRDPQLYGRYTRDFIGRAAELQRPWFLMANAHDPHRPFHGSLQERQKWPEEERAVYPDPSRIFTADEVEAPGFLPDLPVIRGEYAEYLSSSRRCDDVVGAVLKSLEESGAESDTLVIFLSDNGMAFPFAKANCYLRSTQTPLIVRWPGVTVPGSTDADSFVSMLNLFPTICDAIDASTPGDLDGRSLAPLLGGTPENERERVFTVFHETHAKMRFEMRCVQDAHVGYIWNAWVDGERRYKAENMEGLTWTAMVEAAETDEELATRTAGYISRPPEELYDLESDPDCVVNLAGEPGHAVVLADCRRVLGAWMAETCDPLREAFAAHTASVDGR